MLECTLECTVEHLWDKASPYVRWFSNLIEKKHYIYTYTVDSRYLELAYLE